MLRLKRIGVFAVIMLLAASLEIMAQPRGGGGPGGGGRGGGGRGGAGQVLRFLPVEQILGQLAFNENMAVSNDQLLKVREVLKGIHAKRAELQRSMRGNNDPASAMQDVQKLRREMVQGLQAVLNEDQVKGLQEYMQRMNQRGGRGGPGGRGSGRRGGGRQRGGGGDGA